MSIRSLVCPRPRTRLCAPTARRFVCFRLVCSPCPTAWTIVRIWRIRRWTPWRIEPARGSCFRLARTTTCVPPRRRIHPRSPCPRTSRTRSRWRWMTRSIPQSRSIPSPWSRAPEAPPGSSAWASRRGASSASYPPRPPRPRRESVSCAGRCPRAGGWAASRRRGWTTRAQSSSSGARARGGEGSAR